MDKEDSQGGRETHLVLDWKRVIILSFYSNDSCP
jgi:hypothetical protein